MAIKMIKDGDFEKTVIFSVFSNYRVHIVITDNLARSRKARYGTEGKSEGAVALSSSSVDGHSHIFMKEDASAEIIAHESFHIIYRMFEYIGADKMDNEIWAYHLGWLVGKVSEFQARIRNVRKHGRKS